MLTHMLTDTFLKDILAIAEEAGKKTLSIYEAQTVDVKTKADDSPLTNADLLSHATIKEALQALTPTIPFLSEESSAKETAARHDWETLWLVDPLDGTKEFIHRTGEFTVNIALIHNHQPVLGVVVVPAKKVSYFAMSGFGAYKKENDEVKTISVAMPNKPLRVIASRRHGQEALNAFLEGIGEYELVQAGSALKICYVADGQADLYPRLGPTSEWDTAAGHCILNEAGGVLRGIEVQEEGLRYNARKEILNPFFVAHARALSVV